MTVSFRAVALLCVALLLTARPVTANAAEQVRWPVPWKTGERTAYDTESVVREIEDGKTNVRRITNRTEIRTDTADKNGYVLTWTTRDSRIEAVEGDRSMVDTIAPMLDELDGLDVVIELDGDGRYRRVRNLDALIVKVRATMLPMLLASLSDVFNGPDSKLSKRDRDAALQLARSNVEASMDSIISAQSVEAMSNGQAKTMSSFMGKTIELDKRYRDTEPMESPSEGRPLPATREYVLSLVEGDPDLARIRWTQTLDTDGDPKALWALVDELTIGEEKAATRKARPSDLVLREEGMLLFRRDTGVIDMMDITEISRYGNTHDEHQHYRMRRKGISRTWAQEDPAAKP
jgi:hypothetical protein